MLIGQWLKANEFVYQRRLAEGSEIRYDNASGACFAR